MAAARFYFDQLIAGVVYCHSKGVCHRDLRVENLMLDNKVRGIGPDCVQRRFLSSPAPLKPQPLMRSASHDLRQGNLKITDFGHAGIFEQGWDVFQATPPTFPRAPARPPRPLRAR